MKGTIATAAVMYVCKGILDYSVSIMDENDNEKEFAKQLLINLEIEIEKINKRINHFVIGGVFKAHKKITQYLEGRIKNGDKYIGLLLASEILGAWYSEEPVLMSWFKDVDTKIVLEMSETNDDELVNRMFDISAGAIAKLKGWK